MIGIDIYHVTCKLKGTYVFGVSMRDLKYQAEKKTKPEINPKSVISEEYHDFPNILFKKNSDTLPLYQKYDYKIVLEEQQKYNYSPIYKILSQKLDIVKHYL